MLELTEAQLRQMRRHEHGGFVRRVRSDLQERFPGLADDANLLQRLCEAHDHALAFGLESAKARTQFLYQEAFAPGFHEQPAVVAWLTQPGAAPEQRWQDFMALADARLGSNDCSED